jgi:FtsP/CotA-like multicopper oxidase with cupredoxin domain
MTAFIPKSLRGGYFPEYYVYDGGPGDEDGKVNGEIVYDNYFLAGPFSIPGLGGYIRDVLGQTFPASTPDVLHSFLDVNNQDSDVYSAVYLYAYGHFDEKTGRIESVSPGAMLHINPGDKLTINTNYMVDIGKFPESLVGGVAFIEGGGAGSTNMHFHGTNSSPKGYGDNVDFEARADFTNSIKLPKSHHEGLNWWHPHYHSSANAQVYGGAFGNLMIGDPLSHIPAFADAKRSFIGIKNYNVFYNEQTLQHEVKTSGFTPEETARNIHLINGELNPTKGGYQTGEWNSFAFINYTSNSFYNVKIIRTKPGVKFDIKNKATWGEPVDLYIYGKDGYQSGEITQARTGINNNILNGLQLEDPVSGVVTELPAPDLENNLFLSPARRYETLAYFTEPGEYKIISEAWTGAGLRAGGWIWPDIELGGITVEGPAVAEPEILPTAFTPASDYPSISLDLSQFEPLRERRITWSGDLFVEGANRYRKINGGIYNTNEILMNGKPNRYAGYTTPFLINDNVLPYNPALITQLDSLEYWNHENWATEQHPFHPHQNHFQIVAPESGPTDRVAPTAPIPDSPSVRSVLQLFIAYLGRFPDPSELRKYIDFLDSGNSERNLANVLSTSQDYASEFNRFYISEKDQTKDPFLQVADGAYYTLTRENIYNSTTSFYWGELLKDIGIERFPLEMLQQLRRGDHGAQFQARLENMTAAGLYAVNAVATTNPLVSTATALLRVLNQQITDDPLTVSRLYPIIDRLVDHDPNQVTNGESFYGSINRMDTVALPAAMIKSQSYSSPSTNRYPAPAVYNEWEPGRMTTATTFDNFTGGFLQHCHILPHEDTGQAVITKIIDNMERSWFAYKKEFAPGEAITIYRSSTFEPFLLPSVDGSVSRRIAFGDLNKDGFVDIAVGEGDGGSDLVSIYNGRTLELMQQFHAFQSHESLEGADLHNQKLDRDWNHGLHLDIGDITGDGLSDLVVGAGKGGGNHLHTFTNTPGGFRFAGHLTAFDSMPEWANTEEAYFVLGDFDVDNFVDFAFLGSQQAGNPIEVRSSRDGTVLSVFKPGLKGELGLSAGFSSYHNLGLETLYMYEKDAPTAIMQSATLRAAMYVAHSSINDNPYYDAAKYEGYLSADEQLLLTSPLENIPGEIGFDWLINDRRSFAPANGAPAGPLELDATFLGFLANPVITVSHGQNDYVINYTSQHDVAVLPLLGSDVAVQQLQSTVIREFVTYLQRLPSPAELDRFARRLQQKGGDVGYLHQVLTYNGKYDPRNQVSIDAVHDQYYDHVAGELRYAYQGIVNLADRSTYRMLGDEFQARMDLPEPVMANIIAYAFYALAQVAHDMNVHGDLLMYLGPSQKIMTILKTGYMSITEDPATLVTAINDFNFLLRGNYAFPSPNGEPTSPLANGLNVESPSYQEMISTYLHPAFGAPPMVAEHSGHQDHMVDVHSGHHDHTMA